MKQYHKIQSVFKRDPANNHKTFLMGEWSTPALEYLADCQWEWTEKVDGTNIRVILNDSGVVEFRGKTDRAQLRRLLVFLMSDPAIHVEVRMVGAT